jgi:hypothetical protein
MDCYYNVGKAIKRAQAIRDVSNDRLANWTNVTPAQVRRWHRSEDLKVSRLVQLSAMLNMSIDDFLKLGR